MPPSDRFQFYPYNYHLICVRTSTFITFHAYNCLSKCFKKITCFRKQKFSCPIDRRPAGASSWVFPVYKLKWNPATIHHDLINCSQNTRLNFVILGLSLENSHGRLYKKIRKKRTYNNAEKP